MTAALVWPPNNVILERFPACSSTFRAVHDSGDRTPGQIRFIVLHATESAANTAEAVARYFTSSGAGGSAHLVVDDDECFRCLPDLIVPWGAPPLNTAGYHIEHCGYTAWKAADWAQHVRTLERSAFKAFLRCRLYDIPPRRLTDAELAARKPGITTHAQVSRVFRKSTHTDPGSGFPLAWYVDRVKAYFNPDL
jgi:hypothetical protein